MGIRHPFLSFPMFLTNQQRIGPKFWVLAYKSEL